MVADITVTATGTEAERKARFVEAVRDLVRECGELREELRRCVALLDGECTMPDGSNADTQRAHALLGDLEPDLEPDDDEPYRDEEPARDWTDWPSSHRGLGLWRMGGAA